jgi:hypothetical protein
LFEGGYLLADCFLRFGSGFADYGPDFPQNILDVFWKSGDVGVNGFGGEVFQFILTSYQLILKFGSMHYSSSGLCTVN